ncbi:hypothetical protein L7F22_030417 [Adiantum nelumboides]|nr:hypothetical protein [Adiantum nelumboides]
MSLHGQDLCPHPPTLPPHPGAEDGGGLLAGEGQKVRFATKESGEVWVGTSFNGSGGAKVVKTDRSSDKGVCVQPRWHSRTPPQPRHASQDAPSLQHLRNLTSTTLLASLTETAHTTFFLPTEKAFEVLSAIEKTFITGDWALARQDRLKLLGEHMSGIGLGGGRVGYAARLRKKGTVDLTTIFGGQVRIESEPDGKILVAKGKVIGEDLLTENGVVHVIDCLLLPYGDLGLSVEKTLLALNASRFVSLMRTAGLESYIDANPHDNDDPGNEAQPWTFMVPRDDVIEGWWRDQGESGDYAWSKWGWQSKKRVTQSRRPWSMAPSSSSCSSITLHPGSSHRRI